MGDRILVAAAYLDPVCKKVPEVQPIGCRVCQEVHRG
jgi:hypothetical protein